MSQRPRVVIVGAGFGGLAAARKLEKQPVEVTLIDRNNYHTFQPLLYQVATAGLNPADVGYPIRGVFRKRRSVKVKMGEVTGVDYAGQRVHLKGEDPIGYDYLILAAGSTTNYFGTPGAQEHAHPLYTLTDAIELRSHILSMFEAADSIDGLIAEGVLNFVVVGGGATGVEVSGAVSELINKVLEDDFHDLDVSRAQVILAEMGDTLLAPFDEKLRNYAKKTLEKKGVKVRLGEAVKEIHDDHVVLGSGEKLMTSTVVWAAGVKAGALGGALDLPTGRGGRIDVDPDFRVTGHENVFAIGDFANAPDGRGGTMPQLAQPAIQGGKHVAKQILHLMAGKPTKEFKYFDKGIMATIGRSAAVAELPKGPDLTGFIAWLSWLGLHLLYLIGGRNRISVMINWTWNYWSWAHGPRLITDPEPLPKDVLKAIDHIPDQSNAPDND
ncbi:MAG: NAD(P)/FAD-dependent oxidoreductase [Actinobacteria bacterium]|nr:NAD(P)/FAD-dependent oxidoreductase [Actinomycetota bacterium]